MYTYIYTYFYTYCNLDCFSFSLYILKHAFLRQDAFTNLADAPFVSIAAIEGSALGGGLELALACDIRVASNSAKLGLPETGLAIIPGAGGTQRLPRIVGLPKAKEMIYLGSILTAAKALSISLVNEVVEDGQAFNRAVQLAEVLATKVLVKIQIRYYLL